MKISMIGILLAMVFTVAGCTSNPDAERVRPPNYAFMNTSILGSSNGIMWEVNCGDIKVSVADREFDDFYKEDGTQLTQREYCDFARDRIRRRR